MDLIKFLSSQKKDLLEKTLFLNESLTMTTEQLVN